MPEGRINQNHLSAKGKGVTIRLGTGKPGSIVQRRAEIRIALQRFVMLLDALEPDMKERSIARWIAWKRHRQRRPRTVLKHLPSD